MSSPYSDMDAVHALAASLKLAAGYPPGCEGNPHGSRETASAQDVLDYLERLRAVAWPDGQAPSPGTIAWFLAVFLPAWIRQTSEDL